MAITNQEMSSYCSYSVTARLVDGSCVALYRAKSKEDAQKEFFAVSRRLCAGSAPFIEAEDSTIVNVSNILYVTVS